MIGRSFLSHTFLVTRRISLLHTRTLVYGIPNLYKNFSTNPDPSSVSSSNPSSSTSVTSPSTCFFNKMMHSFKEYGWYFVSLYMGLWLGPLAGVYLICAHNNNFGIDILSLIDYFQMQDNMMVQMIPRNRIQPWHTSGLIAYMFAEVFEVVRLPLSLYLAPKLKAKILSLRK